MIIIALVIHLFGHKIPVWITGFKMHDVRFKGGWRRFYFEMSGIFFDFLIAFLILTIVGLSTKERYLLNENVVYGINFNQTAKTFGFKNGDKIITLNNKKVVEFYDIMRDIILTNGDIKIEIKREKYDTVIILTEKKKIELIMDGSTPFIPRLNADTIFNPRNDLVFNERQRSLSKSLAFFPKTIRMVSLVFSPRYSEIGGFVVPIATDLKSFLHLIGWNLIFFGFLNLLPIPGLDTGNMLIALIEMSRKKRLNAKRIKIVKSICIGLISLLMLFIVIYSKI